MEKDVIPTHRAILGLLEQLAQTQTKLYVKYREYLDKNKTLQVFGLDTFLYQCRLLDLELKQAHEHYAFLNNRMYCDYYKLYQMVRVFMKETFQLDPRPRTYPLYKDLEPYKLYETTDILFLYEDLSEMLRKAVFEVDRREKDLTRDTQEKGVRLEHFIHHRTSNHALLTTKIELYEKYLRSYHIYHMSFLSNLLERLQLLFRQTEPPTESPKIYPPEPMNKYLPAEGESKESSTQTDEVLIQKEDLEPTLEEMVDTTGSDTPGSDTTGSEESSLETSHMDSSLSEASLSLPEASLEESSPMDILQIESSQLESSQMDASQIDASQIDALPMDASQLEVALESFLKVSLETSQMDPSALEASQMDTTQMDNTPMGTTPMDTSQMESPLKKKKKKSKRL